MCGPCHHNRLVPIIPPSSNMRLNKSQPYSGISPTFKQCMVQRSLYNVQNPDSNPTQIAPQWHGGTLHTGPEAMIPFNIPSGVFRSVVDARTAGLSQWSRALTVPIPAPQSKGGGWPVRANLGGSQLRGNNQWPAIQGGGFIKSSIGVSVHHGFNKPVHSNRIPCGFPRSPQRALCPTRPSLVFVRRNSPSFVANETLGIDIAYTGISQHYNMIRLSGFEAIFQFANIQENWNGINFVK